MTGMLRYFKYAVILGLIFFIAGCIKVNESIVLKLDGSGSMDITYYIPKVLMKDQRSLRREMTQTGITFPLTKGDFNKQFAGLEGIKVESVKTFTERGYYTIDGKVKFKNINRLKMNNIKFVLKNKDKNKELIIFLINSVNKKQALTSQKTTAKVNMDYKNILKGSLTNYGIKIDVSFPTKVLSANGNIKGRDVKWDVPMNVFLRSKAKEMKLKAIYSGHASIFDRIKDFFR